MSQPDDFFLPLPKLPPPKIPLTAIFHADNHFYQKENKKRKSFNTKCFRVLRKGAESITSREMEINDTTN